MSAMRWSYSMSETGIASPLGDSKGDACLPRSSRAARVKNSMGSPRAGTKFMSGSPPGFRNASSLRNELLAVVVSVLVPRVDICFALAALAFLNRTSSTNMPVSRS
eukprot:122684-Rhodomonas_salina.1